MTEMTSKEYRNYLQSQASPTRKRKVANQQRELTEVQIPLVNYINQVFRCYYPNAILTVNPFADLYLPPTCVHIKAKALERGWEPSEPDVVIKQITPNKAFSGIALELKHKDVYPYRKDGTVKADKHLQAQYKRLCQYREQGFYADFFSGLEPCLNILKLLYGVPIK